MTASAEEPAAHSREPDPPARRATGRPRRSGAIALAAYSLLSFLYFGLPIAAHPGARAVGSDDDPKLFIWMFAWWPHAIAHAENPIVTHAIWAPSGYDLSWATSIPALSLALSPVTLIAGPVVAFNTAAVLLPALAGWTAFLLCRYLTRSFWPSLLGGYLFGFTSYILGHEEGHMNLTAVALVPLVALVVLHAVRRELSERGLVLRLGAILAAQILISTEVFATLSVALVLGAAVAVGVAPSLRGRIASLVLPVTAAYLVAAAIAGPFLYYVFSDLPSGRITTPGIFVADLTNLVVPTRTLAIGGQSSAHITARMLGNELEQTAYLGIPLAVVLCVFFAGRWRDPGARFLCASYVAATVLAFGSGLHVHGHRVAWLPWSLLAGLPALDNVYPERFTLYSTLAAAVAAALWSAGVRSPAWLRVALSLLVVASFAPDLGDHRWDQKLNIPRFFATSTYTRCLVPGETVLVLPYGYKGSSVLWQALSGFRFRMPGGEVGDQPPPPFRTSIVDTLRFDGVPSGGGADTIAFARDKGADAILVDPSDPVPWATLLGGAGPPRRIGGLDLFDLGSPRGRQAGC